MGLCSAHTTPPSPPVSCSLSLQIWACGSRIRDKEVLILSSRLLLHFPWTEIHIATLSWGCTEGFPRAHGEHCPGDDLLSWWLFAIATVPFPALVVHHTTPTAGIPWPQKPLESCVFETFFFLASYHPWLNLAHRNAHIGTKRTDVSVALPAAFSSLPHTMDCSYHPSPCTVTKTRGMSWYIPLYPHAPRNTSRFSKEGSHQHSPSTSTRMDLWIPSAKPASS